MDKRKRSTKLYELGVEAYRTFEGCEEEATLYAVAVMLDAALNPKKGKGAKAPAEAPALLAADVFERFRAELPDLVAYEPRDSSWFGTLQRNIGKINWPDDTLDKLVRWFKTGRGSTFFKKRPATFAMVAQNFKAWATEALNDDGSVQKTGAQSVQFLNGPRGR